MCSSDLAQASAPWGARDWQTAMDQVAPDRWRVRELTVNYRTPNEVMAVASDVLAAVDPQAVTPSSVREVGVVPRAWQAPASDLVDAVLDMTARLRAELPDGKLAVICPPTVYDAVVRAGRNRFGTDLATGADGLDAAVAVLVLGEAKGLEFDGVVLAEPADWLDAGARGLRDLYVALTRTTQRLAVVHTGELPSVLGRLPDNGAAPGSR